MRIRYTRVIFLHCRQAALRHQVATVYSCLRLYSAATRLWVLLPAGWCQRTQSAVTAALACAVRLLLGLLNRTSSPSPLLHALYRKKQHTKHPGTLTAPYHRSLSRFWDKSRSCLKFQRKIKIHKTDVCSCNFDKVIALTKTWHRQSGKDAGNDEGSPTLSKNFMNFGPQTAYNGTGLFPHPHYFVPSQSIPHP